MRSLKVLRSAVAVSVVALVFSSINATASQAVTWASGVTWGTLHVKPQTGIFEKFRREYSTGGSLLSNSPTQHDYAWIRTDQTTATVQFRGGVGNAGKSIQFVIDNPLGTPYTDNIDGVDNIAVADSTGLAEITVTVASPLAGDTLTVGLKAGGDLIGPMVLQWQDAGYGPVVKMLGTTGGRQAKCVVDPGYVDGIASNAAHSCLQSDLHEVTWVWSVFSRDWVTDYAQTYTKSYLPGDTIKLNYRVTDIWGTPISGKQVHLDVDAKCAVCKWGNYPEDKDTNAQGLVSFAVPNRNTVAQVKDYKSVNQDTKEQNTGIVAFAITPTTREVDENVDYFWPQIVSNTTLKSTSVAMKIASRGGVVADAAGNVVTGGVTNPVLNTDPFGLDQRDLIRGRFSILYEKNIDAKPNFVYAPTITVSADNGGYVAKVEPTANADDVLDVSQMSHSISFNYVYNYVDPRATDGVELVFAGARPGITTFTVQIGALKTTFTQEFTNSPDDARYVVPVLASATGIKTKAKSVAFQVVDRFGGGIAGVPVDVATSGAGTLASSARLTSDAKGFVRVTANSSSNGQQTITATAVVEAGTTQIDGAAIEKWNVSAGSAIATAKVEWGRVEVASVVGAKKLAKFNVLNAAGKVITILQGTKKLASYKPTTANHLKSLALAPGTYKLTIKVAGAASATKIVTIKVS